MLTEAQIDLIKKLLRTSSPKIFGLFVKGPELRVAHQLAKKGLVKLKCEDGETDLGHISLRKEYYIIQTPTTPTHPGTTSPLTKRNI